MSKPSASFDDLHEEFMGPMEGDESPGYYVARAILLLAAEVRDLRVELRQRDEDNSK